MKRREFITLLGGAAASSVLWPLAARAQQPLPIPQVGLVSIGADPGDPVVFRPFLEQIRKLGYVDGQNLILQRRFAAGHDELVAEFVADLVQRKVDIIVVTGAREAIAARQATSTIPIVMIANPDPIRSGLAASLARPGGNVTGLTNMDWGIYGKRIEILQQAVPGLSKATLLLSRGNAIYARGSPWEREVEADGRSLGVELSLVETGPDDVEAAVASAAAGGSQGLVGASDGVIVARRREIAESAIRHRLPTMFAFRENVEAGGLMMYAARVADLSRRAAFFVDRILKGARPSELPIEQPTTFELVVNLKTAKALGLAISESFLLRADEVIE
jgi:putative tryptophan/tyrosine transport system substrate-binding protein